MPFAAYTDPEPENNATIQQAQSLSAELTSLGLPNFLYANPIENAGGAPTGSDKMLPFAQSENQNNSAPWTDEVNDFSTISDTVGGQTIQMSSYTGPLYLALWVEGGGPQDSQYVGYYDVADVLAVVASGKSLPGALNG